MEKAASYVLAAGHLFPLSNPFFYLGNPTVLNDLSLIVLLSITGVSQVPRPEEEIANETPTYKVAILVHDSYVKMISGICYVWSKYSLYRNTVLTIFENSVTINERVMNDSCNFEIL